MDQERTGKGGIVAHLFFHTEPALIPNTDTICSIILLLFKKYDQQWKKVDESFNAVCKGKPTHLVILYKSNMGAVRFNKIF